TSVCTSCTFSRCPTSSPLGAPSSRPSTGGLRIRTHLPLSHAPLANASKTPPILHCSSSPPPHLAPSPPHLLAPSPAPRPPPASLPARATSSSSPSPSGARPPPTPASTSLCGMRSGKRRFGAVECA